MPTYYIRLGESQERDALVSNLIGTLEKLYGIVVHDAIEVVLEVDDPAGDLIRSLAKDVIPNRPTFSELVANTGERSQERAVYELEGKEVFFPHPDTSVGVVAVAPGTEVQLNSGMVVKAPTTNTGTVYVGEPAQEEELSAVEKAISKVSDKKRKCPRCGKTYTPASNRQMFCSKQCRIMAQAGQGNGANDGVKP